MFYLTMHSTHFIYGYMASDIWLRTILIVRKETRCRNIGYSFRLAAMVILYAPPHRQDSTNHGLCYTSRGALAGTRILLKRDIANPIAPPPKMISLLQLYWVVVFLQCECPNEIIYSCPKPNPNFFLLDERTDSGQN